VKTTHSASRIVIVLVLALAALAGTLALMALGDNAPARAAVLATTRYVAPDGSDATECESVAKRCATIQRAVDVADPTDEIRVAQGTYSGVHARPASSGYDTYGSSTVTQVVYITGALTLRGGYDATFTGQDPQAHPTTIDAAGAGRAVFIGGSGPVTLEGFHLTNGDAAGQGGQISGFDAGGAVEIYEATAVISDCQATHNTALAGGAISIMTADVTLTGNHLAENTASAYGGALRFQRSNVILNDNYIFSNTARINGGGIEADGGTLTLNANRFEKNVARVEAGGAMELFDLKSFTADSNLFINNQAAEAGDHLSIWRRQAELRHNTFVGDGEGSGINLQQSNQTTMTNNIIVAHGTGVLMSTDSTVNLNRTLWGSGAWANGQDWGSKGTVHHSDDLYADPQFVDPASGDYHIAATSPARDRALRSAVSTDVDGEPRPMGYEPDIGADEYTFTDALPVQAFRVHEGSAAGGTLTATLAWRAPGDAVHYTLRYATAPITAGNWNAATLLTDTLAGGASTYVAQVPYGGGQVYFAIKHENHFGNVSPLSENAFWPVFRVNLPLLRR
jgi:hypothetical protein